MIEGIVGLFVILFLFLVVPSIIKIARRWWEIYNEPVEINTDRLTYDFDKFVYAAPSDMPPANPVFGQTWMNTQNKTAYMWNGDVWSPYHTPKEGDVWFW